MISRLALPSSRRSSPATTTGCRPGYITMLALVFMALCAAMAGGLYSLVQGSTAISGNERRVARALGATESGLQFLQYQISQALKTTTATLTPANTDLWMPDLRDNLATILDGSNGIVGANVIYAPAISPDAAYITIPSVSFGSDARFSGRILTNSSHTGLLLEVTGVSGAVSRKARVRLTINQGPVLFPLEARLGIPSAWDVTPDGATKVKQYGTPTPLTLADGATCTMLLYPGMTLPSTPAHFPNNDALITAVAELKLPAKVLLPGATISGTDGNYRIPPNTNCTITGTINGVVYVEWPNNITLGGDLTINGTIVFQRKGSLSGTSTLTLLRDGVIHRPMDAADTELTKLDFTGNDKLKWWALIAPDADLILPNGTVWDTTKAFEGSLHFNSFSRAGGGDDCGFTITKGGMVAEGTISIQSNGASYVVNSDTVGDASARLAWSTYEEPLN